MPAAAHRALRGAPGLPAGPVAITRTVVRAGVPDIRAPLLCRQCEQRLSRNGENWVLKRISKGERFPLLERLKLAIPITCDQGRLKFSGPRVGILTEKLAYFAVSMLWRSVVYPWRGYGGTRKKRDIGSLEEDCRRYLLGETGFPESLWVYVAICSDTLSRHSAHDLAEMETPFTTYSFLICGIFFALMTGNDVRQEERDRCCIRSVERPIFVEDRSVQNITAFYHLRKSARITKAVQDGAEKFKQL
jgi:hypothetical protein